MAKTLSKSARDALAATDWSKVDAMTDEDIARQIASNPDAAPDMAPVIDVRAIRLRLDLSQDDFAAAFGFTVDQIKGWEQGRSRPLGGVRAYLTIIDRDPKRVISLLRAAAGRR